MLELLKLARGKILGTSAINAKMNLLESKLGALEGNLSAVNTSVDRIARRLGRLNADPAYLPTGTDVSEATEVGVIEKIAFLVQTEELINHYGCIWDRIPVDAFEIVLHDGMAKADRKIFQRWECNVTTTADILTTQSRYRYLVSNHPVSLEGQPLIHRLANQNIRFMYAAGKSGWNLSNWNELYDMIFCFGPYHANEYSDRTDAVVIQMGYPRFDAFFNEQTPRAELMSRFGCSPEKPTVVWLPTWKTLSSVGQFSDEISALLPDYNVIVKVHPLMPEQEPGRVAELCKLPFTRILTDATDNMPLYQLADYMLFDYGGPPMAGIYTDKKMILLNVPGALHDSLTGEDSPDVEIRKHMINVNSGERRLADVLQDQDLWAHQARIRRALRKIYFAPYFGFSADVVAQALLRLDRILVAKGGHDTW